MGRREQPGAYRARGIIMRIIIINPTDRSITQEDVPGKVDRQAINQRLGGSLCFAGKFSDGHTLYVDDDGLLKGEQDCFEMPSLYLRPLAGLGLIVGPETEDENEDITDATLSLQEVQNGVQWLGTMSTKIDSIQHETGDPNMTHFESQPTYKAVR